MIKKLVGLLVAVFVLAFAVGALADGVCGAEVTWTLSPSGVLTISGKGEIDDCSYGRAPWKDERDSIKSVIVEEGVTGIGNNAFYWCRELTNVQLPESLVTIGDYAFENCSRLNSINIPNGVTSIGEWAFYGCENLPVLTLPDNLVSIGALAFCDCENLMELVIPASVTYISEDRTFKGCDKLEKIVVADGNPAYITVDGVLFNYDKNTLINYPAGKKDSSYTVPNSVTSINDYGFYWNENIQSITVPGTVKSIGSDVFAGCSKLTSLALAEGIESIGETAFFHASALTSISFPASLASLGNDPFESCSMLTNINVAENSSFYKSVNGVLFSSDMKTLIAYPAGLKAVSYTIPEGVVAIGAYAFLHNHNVVNITFPDSLVTIGHSAFYGCDKLTGIQFPNNLATIEDDAFGSCDSLTTIVLPESVYILGDGAFNWCDNLINVTIMNPATSFNKWGVFDFCHDALTLTGIAGSTTEYHAKENELNFTATTFEKNYLSDNSLNDSWTCESCSSVLNGGKFCSECGKARPQAQKCTNCGYMVEKGNTMKFCPECGTKF